jgi:hypothetical protein
MQENTKIKTAKIIMLLAAIYNLFWGRCNFHISTNPTIWQPSY